MDKLIKIKLSDYTQIKKFVQLVETFDCDIDMIRGRYIIDAKSIMGMFSLDLSQPVDVIIHSEDDEEINRFYEAMKEFAA